MRLLAGFYFALSTLVAASCLPSAGGGGAQQNGNGADPAEEFTNALAFGVQNTPTSGSLPTGSSTGPQVVPLTTTPTTANPGFPLQFVIPYSGGAINAVNISFGGSTYFNIPVPAAGTATSGMVTVPANLMASVCSNLANICHQIKCYEQVTTSAGTISKATAQQIVLNCTGGADCNGNVVPDGGNGTCTASQFRCGDGTCIPASSACNSTSDCADGSDEDPNTCGNQGSCCIATAGCPGETGSSCASSCCCCPSAQACCPDPTQGCCASP